MLAALQQDETLLELYTTRKALLDAAKAPTPLWRAPLELSQNATYDDFVSRCTAGAGRVCVVRGWLEQYPRMRQAFTRDALKATCGEMMVQVISGMRAKTRFCGIDMSLRRHRP